MAKSNRKYKDRLFRLIFADEKNKKNTLSLYNMLNNSSYENEEDLEITTLKDVLYIKMKNDLSFIIADTMNLYEQQSTHNPNMPLRGFLYFGSLYEKYLDTHGLTYHSKSLVKIPTPNYIVFYNGTDKRPLLTRCKPLSDYTYLVSKIQTYVKTMTLKQAINKAVDECIAEDILAEFLRAHQAEVLKVYLAEVNEKVLRKCFKDEGREEYLEELITKKIKAGKPLEQIAEEVESTVDAIQELYQRIKDELAKEDN